MSHKRLSKELGLLDVFAISTGAMISSGFFLLPGIAAAKAGPAVIAAYVLSGVLMVPSLLSMAELATAMPRAGGTYFFISRSLGSMFGTIDGIGDWLALVMKSSIALVGLGAYLGLYLHLPQPVIVVFFCLLFAVVNTVGAKEVSGLQVAMVVALLMIMVFFVGTGLPAIDGARLQPFAPFGVEPILPTAGLLFVSYIGATKVASVAEEVRNPERNIPLGMILSLAVVVLIYALGVWVVVGVLPPDELYVSMTPVADAAGKVVGWWGTLAISLAGFLAFATTANAGLLSASRYLLAMGRDQVISHRFADLSKFHTPQKAIMLTSGVALGVVLTTNVAQIAKMASAFQLLVFGFINIAVIVMRESGINSYDPGFKSPLYPYMQVGGIMVSVILIPEMGLLPTIFAMALVGLGIAWYNLYVRHQGVRVGAVAEMAARVAERLLQRDAHAMGLDRELRQILKEKGLRSDDPFAQMVGNAQFLELESDLRPEAVLKLGATLLSKQSGVSRDLILGGLLERSRLGETPAEAGIALPHLLLEDVDGFYMVAARSASGIDFPMADQPIHAVFLLLGNSNDPSQHLRFLAEIARRAENPRFLVDWLGVESTDDLPKLLLEGSAAGGDVG